MRPKMGIIALVMALMLVPIAGFNAIAQDATPEATAVNGIDCDRSIDLFDSEALPRVQGVNVIFACGHFFEGDSETNKSGGLVILGTLSTIAPNLKIENPIEGVNIRQTGTANVTVIQGSLTVGLVANCAVAPNCRGGTGVARFARTNAENQVVWTDLVVGDPPTKLLPGDLLIVENVTVTFTSGEEGALVASSGAYNPGPAEGCPVRCWQFP
jgi:hypothetical protein